MIMGSWRLTGGDRKRFKAARRRGRRTAEDVGVVLEAQYERASDSIRLVFRSGASVTIPRKLLPELGGLPWPTLEAPSISPAGDALLWLPIDADVDVAGLLNRAFGLLRFAAVGQGASLRRSTTPAATVRLTKLPGLRRRR
jgi:hypothetical protein